MLSDDESDNHSSEKEIESDNEEQERLEIRGKLGTMSFEELLKMKEEIGSKMYNKMLTGDNNTKKPIIFKRANKNRPQEISSKIKPKVLQRTLPKPKLKQKKLVIQHRDPRFDPLCGEFDKDTFKDNYKFIYDLQEKEKQILIEEEKMEQDVDKKKKIKSAIQRLNNKSVEKKKIDEKHQKRIQEKTEMKEMLKKGQKPFKKKKSTEKAEDLINQYEDLKKSNKLGKYLIKKSKKLNFKEAKNYQEDAA